MTPRIYQRIRILAAKRKLTQTLALLTVQSAAPVPDEPLSDADYLIRNMLGFGSLNIGSTPARATLLITI